MTGMQKERTCAKCKKPLTGKLHRATRCTECQREVNTFGKNARTTS